MDLAHRGDAALRSKLPQFVRRLGEAHKAAGQLEEAEVALRDVLRHEMPLPEKLQVLALLADVQMKEDSAELEVKVQQRLQEELKAAGGDVSKVGLRRYAAHADTCGPQQLGEACQSRSQSAPKTAALHAMHLAGMMSRCTV